jgi:small subunit ribosomal protein S21
VRAARGRRGHPRLGHLAVRQRRLTGPVRRRATPAARKRGTLAAPAWDSSSVRPQPAKGGEFPNVSEVKVREGETFESALRRFNKKIKQNGILSEVRRREHYEKPSVRRKRKLVAAKKRRLKAG